MVVTDGGTALGQRVHDGGLRGPPSIHRCPWVAARTGQDREIQRGSDLVTVRDVCHDVTVVAELRANNVGERVVGVVNRGPHHDGLEGLHQVSRVHHRVALVGAEEPGRDPRATGAPTDGHRTCVGEGFAGEGAHGCQRGGRLGLPAENDQRTRKGSTHAHVHREGPTQHTAGSRHRQQRLRFRFIRCPHDRGSQR